MNLLFHFLFSTKTQKPKLGLFSAIQLKTPPFFFSTEAQTKIEEAKHQNSTQVFKKWGCSVTDLAKIFDRQPSLRNANPVLLESKLSLLTQLGIQSSDLVKMINRRPRFLSCGFNRCFDDKLKQLLIFFENKEALIKAIVRNPSLLIYDFNTTVKPVLEFYQEMGLSRRDFISMVLHRPTLIHRTKMCEEKLDYIRRTGVSSESKMYKYVVAIIGVSRIQTINEKVVNFEKFGFSEDEVLQLFGRSPVLMTLSVEKVQRNMTFVVASMKFSPKLVVDYPFLLFVSLEDLLKPRVLLGWKIQDMDLNPQMKGPKLITALRMSEKRFLKVFVMCHKKEVKEELLEYYRNAKGMKRLAESSKKFSYTAGFPF